MQTRTTHLRDQIRVQALRHERDEVLVFLEGLDESEWETPSRAEGWRVQDVVAHLGATCHSVSPLVMMAMMRSKDVEQTNEDFVGRNKDWSPAQTLADYRRWSRIMVGTAGVLARTPVAKAQVPLAELGKFPMGMLMCSAMVFDHHTHLRHDIAPAVGRPAPDSDAGRMGVVIEWMLAVLHNQLRAAGRSSLQAPVQFELFGPGGGTWSIRPDGAVDTGPAVGAAATIMGAAKDFPDWGTRRSSWRDHDVQITGDDDLAVRFLDSVRVV